MSGELLPFGKKVQSDVDTESLLQPSDATVATSRPVYNEDAVDDESSPQSGQWPSRPSTSFAQTCMKFLKETYQGTFNGSPGKQDEEDVDSKFIFYGPVQLQGHGPFSVPGLGIITK